MNEIKTLLRSRYGVNQIITGEYDETLAVKCRNGIFVGARLGDLTAFHGIPFAKPPVGCLRWKAPQPPEDCSDVFEAYYNGKTAIQTEWYSEQASYYPQGEDCLYLNLWLNRSDESRSKPVMVFFHGGSYGWGGTADPMYDGARLVGKHPDIILVSAAYRIGLTGFVDFTSVKGGEDYPDAPNLGMLDQIEALRWVKENIAAFGGDPDNVTIFGESAGGGSASLLPMIPQAKGLFRRAIAESGSVALTFSKQECQPYTEKLMKAAKASCMNDLLQLSEDDLKRINEELNDYNNFPQRDGRLIPFDPYLPYTEGATADVDLMIGTNSDEMNYWIGEIGGIVPYRVSMTVKFENDLKKLGNDDKKRVREFIHSLSGHNLWRMSEFYNETMFRLPAIRQAEGHAANGGRTYMYYWTTHSAIPMRRACHAVELAYVFGNLEETIYTGQRVDETQSDRVMQMWTNFARNGDPSTDDLEWDPYSADTRNTMILVEKPHIVQDPLKNQRETLSPLLRYMINPSYVDLDYNVPYMRKLAIGGVAALTAITASVILIKKLLEK